MNARPRLEAIARMRTGSQAAAEDLIQDTWLKLEKSSFEETLENPIGFITRVANHTVTDHLRKERRRAEIDNELANVLWNSVDEVSPERKLLGNENLIAVSKALDALPEKTRRIFLMNRIEGISHRKIAALLEISDQAVYYHIRRALEHLATLRDELID